MDLLKQADRQGRQYLVYMDAEFQTFRLPAGPGDGLATVGYVNTPYLYGMAPTNVGQNNYHFLLNLGFIVFDGTGKRTYNFAMFPSLFNVKSPLFNNGQMLEPGYTTCAPAVAAAIEGLRLSAAPATATAPATAAAPAAKFPFYKTLSLGKREIFRKINDVYNGSLSAEEQALSIATLQQFIQYIVPRAVIVHKGRNDLYALRNSALLHGLSIDNLLSRDLDTIQFRLPGLATKQLGAIQGYLVEPPAAATAVPAVIVARAPALRRLRDIILAEVAAYFNNLWHNAGEVTAHNPLVDCAYAMVMDIGLLGT